MSVPSRWVCPSCRANNMPEVGACFRCHAPRPVQGAAPSPSATPPPGIPQRITRGPARPAWRPWAIAGAVLVSPLFCCGAWGFLAAFTKLAMPVPAAHVRRSEILETVGGQYVVTCPMCHGAGRVGERTCPGCGGTGRGRLPVAGTVVDPD